ncbi:MAG: hypothetical protein ABIB47_03185 [Candidatus Woesearchaeota archaeon]
MEFLMTYGWAILVVLIAIGALAYFGVLSPGKFLPQSCTLAPGFACDDFKIDNVVSTSDDLTIIVRNGVGATANSVIFTVNENTATGPLCIAAAGNPTSIAEGNAATFTWNCPSVDDTTAQGTRFKGISSLTYTLTGQTLSHTVTGDLTARIE